MFRKVIVNIVRRNLYRDQIVPLATTTTTVPTKRAEYFEESVAAAGVSGNKEGDFSKYTQDEIRQILNIVNSENEQELLKYGIAKTRVSKLHAWKTRNGALQSLEDILQIESFGSKVAEKFYQKLLQGPTAKETRTKRRISPFLTPAIDTEQLQSIRSCVSVRIGVSSVTWTRLEVPSLYEDTNSPCILTDWQHHDIHDRRLHLNDLIQRCLYFNHLIPAADCYLFENPQMALANTPGNAERQNINIQKAQITAVLGYALQARGDKFEVMSNEHAEEDVEEQEKNIQTKSVSKQNVFYVRRFLPARLFNHLVGTERVSSTDTILNLMRTYYNIDDRKDYHEEESVEYNEDQTQNDDSSFPSIRGNVHFSPQFRNMFEKAEGHHREFLGQALLLNLAFVRLILLQDQHSIGLVSRKSNSVKEIGEQ